MAPYFPSLPKALTQKTRYPRQRSDPWVYSIVLVGLGCLVGFGGKAYSARVHLEAGSLVRIDSSGRRMTVPLSAIDEFVLSQSDPRQCYLELILKDGQRHRLFDYPSSRAELEPIFRSLSSLV